MAPIDFIVVLQRSDSHKRAAIPSSDQRWKSALHQTTNEGPDNRRDYGDARVRAIGKVDGMVLHVVDTDRGNMRRIISARLADRKEQN